MWFSHEPSESERVAQGVGSPGHCIGHMEPTLTARTHACAPKKDINHQSMTWKSPVHAQEWPLQPTQSQGSSRHEYP